MSLEIQILTYTVAYGPSVFQAYRIIKSGKKIITKNIKLTGMNFLQIIFYEPFLAYDLIKLIRQKVDKKRNLVKSKDSSFYLST